MDVSDHFFFCSGEGKGESGVTGRGIGTGGRAKQVPFAKLAF